MTLKPMRGAAVAAELAVVSREPARDCPQPLTAFAGPSRDERELAGMSGPAADRRLPASSTPNAVSAEVTQSARVSSVITAAVAPDPCLVGIGQVRPQRGRRTGSLLRQAAIRWRADGAGKPRKVCPRTGRRGCSCALSGPELCDRQLTP
jgi:hypothetical protein